jgi:hypothetical protein
VFSFLENVVLGFDFCDLIGWDGLDRVIWCGKKILEVLSTKMEVL